MTSSWFFLSTLNYDARSTTDQIYLLNPCGAVLLEKLTGSQLVKIFPAFYGTRRFITAFTTARHLSLSSARSILSTPTPPTYFLKIHLNIILPSTHGSSRWSVSLFSPPKPCISSPLPHTYYMPRPSHSSRFDHPNNTWGRSKDH